jgi:hypothetical protein
MTPGMSATVGEPRTYKGVEILSVNYSMGEQAKGVSAMPSLLSNFNSEMAFTDKEVIYTTGKPAVMNAAIDRLKAQDGMRIDNAKAFKDVFPAVQGEPVKVLHLRLLELMKAAMKGMPGVNVQQLGMIPDDASSIGSYSYKDGSEVIGILRVSLEEAAAIKKSVPMALGVLTQAALMGALQSRGPADPAETRALCVRNLRIIDAAKEQCALDRGLNEGAAVQEEWLHKYLFGGRMLTCPDGKAYKINPLGQPPQCSVPGHSLD